MNRLVATEVNISSNLEDIRTLEYNAKVNPRLNKTKKHSKIKNCLISDEGSETQNSSKFRKSSAKTAKHEMKQQTALNLHCPICKVGIQNKSQILGHMRMKLEQQCKSFKLYFLNCQRLSIHKMNTNMELQDN